MKIPLHITELRRAVEGYCGTALDHQDYVDHNSAAESVQNAEKRFNDARERFRKALEMCAKEEGVVTK